MSLNIQLERIQDPVVRESFQKLISILNANPFTTGDWKVYEGEFSAAGQFPIKHNLSFIPDDCLLIHIEGNYNFYFRYDLFDRENIYVTAAGPCRVRFIAGRAGRA